MDEVFGFNARPSRSTSGQKSSAPPPENTRSRRFTMWIGAEAYDFDISWQVTAIHRRHASPVPAVETPGKERRDFPDSD